MPYNLKILSPVHIGCGEEYSGLSYLIDKRKKPPQICIVTEDLVFTMLNDFQIISFVKWIETERFPNLFSFFRNILKDENFTLQNELQRKSIYSIPNFAGEERLRPINAFIKQMYHPYIPGSEIKGAIRTAVLYRSIFEDNNLKSWFIEAINNFKTKNDHKINLVKNKINLEDRNPHNPREKLHDIKKDLADKMGEIDVELQQRVFNRESGDAKYDVMKYLLVGDSILLDAKEALAVGYAKPFNMESRQFTLFNEYMRPGITVPLTFLSIEQKKSLKQKLEKMAFNDRQKNLVSSIDYLLECCFRFSSDLIQEEITYFSKHGKNNIVEHLKEIEAANEATSPVLRIGKDEGFNSLTVGLAVKKIDIDLYKNALIHATKGKSYDLEFPKTRKIVHWNDRELTAGWVKLIPVGEKKATGKASTAAFQQKTLPPDLSELKKKFNKGDLRR